MNEIINELKSNLKEENVLINESMSNHTTFKTGGNADIYVTPENINDIKSIINICKKNNLKYYVIGNGSNLLVKDGGFRGVIIDLNKHLNKIEVNENKIIAQSGALYINVSNTALKNSLTGLEFAAGIPGTIGGAVIMNAQCYGGETKDVIETITVLDDNNIKKITPKEANMGYRNSNILKNNQIVLSATFKLEKGNKEEIKSQMVELNKKRNDKQPINYPSAGSTFKRPEGYYAGKLIEDSGLKGLSVNGAEVSEKHAGFIINKNNATSSDILKLIEKVKEIVKEKYNVELEEEIKIIGEN